MKKLLIIHGANFHENTIGLVSAFVVPNGKGLSSLRRALVNDIKLRWRVLAEEITENKLGLGLAVGLDLPFDRDIDRLEEVFG